jgi:hypothetical protein
VLLIERQPVEIALPPVDVVKQPAGFDQLVDHLPFAVSHAIDPERHIDVLPFRETLGYVPVLGRDASRQENGGTENNDETHSKVIAPGVR